MIKFIELEAECFQLLKQVTLTFEGAGLTGVLGGNGQGKTTLFDALLYCLYGRTSKGIRGDGVLPKDDPSGTRVKVTWVEGDNVYSVIRYRKHDACPKNTKSGAYLFVNGKQQSLKSDDQVTSQVVSLLGADFKTFMNTIIFGQHMDKRFPELEDSEKQKIWDNVLDTSWLPAVRDLAREQREDAKEEFRDLEKTVSIYTQEEDSLREEYREYQQSSEKRIKELELKKAGIQNKVSELETTCASIEDEVKGLRKQLKDIPDQQEPVTDEWDDIIERCNLDDKSTSEKLTKYLDARKQEGFNLQAERHGLREKKARLESLGPECGTCEQSVSEEYRDAQYSTIETRLVEIDEADEVNRNRIREAKRRADTRLKESAAKRNAAEESKAAALEEYNTYLEGTRKQDALRQSIETKTKEVEQHRKVITIYQDQASDLSNSTELDEETGRALRAKRNEVQGKLKEAKKRLEGTRRQYRVLDYWVDACGIRGIRSHLVAQVMPTLNQFATHYSEVLSGGTVQALFTDQKVLANGDIRHGFYEEVMNLRGVADYKEMSGGERQLVNMIISLSLHDLVATRSTKSFNLAVFDEVFDSLDADNTETMIRLLTDLGGSKEALFVISHKEELKSRFNNVIRVKDGELQHV